MTTTLGISRDSFNAVKQALTDMPHLNVSQISRVCDDLSRHTVYKALELLKAERDDTYFPATYTLSGESYDTALWKQVYDAAFSVTGSEEQAADIADEATGAPRD